MKGAIGNAFILNIVITFILIFLLLVVGSMAYTKAYKVKNFLLNEVVQYVEENGSLPRSSSGDSAMKPWDDRINSFLANSGYHLSTTRNSCPAVNSSKFNGKYGVHINTRVGQYEYCVYSTSFGKSLESFQMYLVLVYMKLDLPVVGNYVKIPITGETRAFIVE